MFAELVCIALAVCLLFCESTEGRLADAMSFETLLGPVVMIILLAMFKPLIDCRILSTYYYSFRLCESGVCTKACTIDTYLVPIATLVVPYSTP
jgi:hypothetical protein